MTRTRLNQTDEDSIDAYFEAGGARAQALGNRGPIQFDAEGRLDPAIVEGYNRTGFYVFEHEPPLLGRVRVANKFPDVKARMQLSDFLVSFGRDFGSPRQRPTSVGQALVLPIDSAPPRPLRNQKRYGEADIVFAKNRTLDIRNDYSFRSHLPTAHTFVCLRFADRVTETVARLTTGSGGLTPGRAGFAPAG